MLFRPVPAGVPKVQRLREDVIVNKAGVDRECAHEKNDITAAANVVNINIISLGDCQTY